MSYLEAVEAAEKQREARLLSAIRLALEEAAYMAEHGGLGTDREQIARNIRSLSPEYILKKLEGK